MRMERTSLVTVFCTSSRSSLVKLVEAFDAGAKFPLIFLRNALCGSPALVRRRGGRILFLGWLRRVWKASPALSAEQRSLRGGAAPHPHQCPHTPPSGFAPGSLLG